MGGQNYDEILIAPECNASKQHLQNQLLPYKKPPRLQYKHQLINPLAPELFF